MSLTISETWMPGARSVIGRRSGIESLSNSKSNSPSRMRSGLKFFVCTEVSRLFENLLKKGKEPVSRLLPVDCRVVR